MSGRTIEYAVPPEGEGKRVRSVLQGQLGLSAGLVTKLKHRPDSVRINGAPARTIDILHAGDVLAVDVGDAKPGAFSPGGPRPDVVWEDDDILIINKPAGMAVHGRSERGEPTVGSMVSAYLGTNTPFHPVNRLDRGTTGLMCAAKNGYMHDRLRRMLHTELFRREYLAICVGIPPEEHGIIDAPIARAGEEKRFCTDPGGAPSLTHYKVELAWDGLCLVRLRPETGRTHQIRVHMASIGCALLGDRLYGRLSRDISRPALHSAALRLVHPLTGEDIRVTAPLPDDMRCLLPDGEAEF